ncbi:hypothetical protein ACF0H5_009054 [Mactra antiquata]
MVRLILDYKDQFPQKLYDVVCDGGLFRWNRNGSVSVLDEESFVNNVMKWYPGFLQIPSFQNLKRLFREYGFDRVVNQNYELEFSHPYFQYGRRDLLTEIRTRRKSFRTPNNHTDDDGSLIIPTDGDRRYSSRSRTRTKRFRSENSNLCSSNNIDLGGGGDVEPKPNSYIIRTPIKISESVVSNQSNQSTESEKSVDSNDSRTKKNFEEIMRLYAEKEYSEDEYQQWLNDVRKLEDSKKPKVEEPIEKSAEYWWLYENQDKDLVQTVPVHSPQVVNEVTTPCGFCKCCSSISNYVHLFGEIPENIQVIDCLEEVVTTSDVDNKKSCDI